MSSSVRSYSHFELDDERFDDEYYLSPAERLEERRREFAEYIQAEMEDYFNRLDWDMEDRIAELPQLWTLHENNSQDPDPTIAILRVCREKGQLALELDPNIDRYDSDIDFDLDQMLRAAVRSSVSDKFFDGLELAIPATSRDTAHRLRRLKRSRRRQDHGTRSTQRHDKLETVERRRRVKPIKRRHWSDRSPEAARQQWAMQKKYARQPRPTTAQAIDVSLSGVRSSFSERDFALSIELAKRAKAKGEEKTALWRGTGMEGEVFYVDDCGHLHYIEPVPVEEANDVEALMSCFDNVGLPDSNGLDGVEDEDYRIVNGQVIEIVPERESDTEWELVNEDDSYHEGGADVDGNPLLDCGHSIYTGCWCDLF